DFHSFVVQRFLISAVTFVGFMDNHMVDAQSVSQVDGVIFTSIVAQNDFIHKIHWYFNQSALQGQCCVVGRHYNNYFFVFIHTVHLEGKQKYHFMGESAEEKHQHKVNIILL